MGMNIEVTGKIYYTVHLDDKDVELIKKYINDHKKELPYFSSTKNICWSIKRLYADDKIDLFADGKATKSDFAAKEINWSEFEERTPEEILT